jgi:hypothetical protein
MFNARVEYIIPNQFDKGNEIHLITQELPTLERILNIRVFHVAPLQSGHTGYSKNGFYLTKNEAEKLRDNLDEILDNNLLGIPTISDEPQEESQ